MTGDQSLISVDGEQLSLREAAVLAMTNSHDAATLQSCECAVLTTKESYAWALAIAEVLEQSPELTPDELRSAIAYGVEKHAHELADAYSQLYDPVFRHEDGDPRWELARKIFNCFRDYLRKNHAVEFYGHDYAVYSYLVGEIQPVLKSLEDKDLVEDPIELAFAGALVAVLGFVPINFSRRTKKGDKTYLKLESLFYEYERETSKNKTHSQFRLKIIPLIKTFKKHFTGLMDDALKIGVGKRASEEREDEDA